MESQILHTVWCNFAGEAAGEVWNSDHSREWLLKGYLKMPDFRRKSFEEIMPTDLAAVSS